jgi:hypothetical protein
VIASVHVGFAVADGRPKVIAVESSDRSIDSPATARQQAAPTQA